MKPGYLAATTGMLVWMWAGCKLRPDQASPSQPKAGSSTAVVAPVLNQAEVGTSLMFHAEAVAQRLALDISGETLSEDLLDDVISRSTGPAGRVDKAAMDKIIDIVFHRLTWNEQQERAPQGFSDWLVEFHRDIFKLYMPRKSDGISANVLLDNIPSIAAINARYNARFPDRYFNPDLGDPTNGALDTAPSSEKHVSDLGYYLLEMESALFAAAVVVNNKPYSQLLISRESVSNSLMEAVHESRAEGRSGFSFPEKADFYHWTGEWHFHPARFQEGAGGSGVLTHQAMLETYANPRQWANRAIYNMWLCREITPAPRPENIEFAYRKKEHSPPLEQPDCAGCHYLLDGISNLRFVYPRVKPFEDGREFLSYLSVRRLLDWNSSSKAVLKEFNSYNSTTFPKLRMPHYLIESDFSSFQAVRGFDELGQALAEHPWFASCTGERLFTHLFNRPPTTVRDQWLVAQAAERFRQHQDSFKDALKFLVTTPDYYIQVLDTLQMSQSSLESEEG